MCVMVVRWITSSPFLLRRTEPSMMGGSFLYSFLSCWGVRRAHGRRKQAALCPGFPLCFAFLCLRWTI